jgi:hypothetical protein
MLASVTSTTQGCGELVRPMLPDSDVSHADSVVQDGDVADAPRAEDARPDAPRLRNTSTVSVDTGESASDGVAARLLGDEAVSQSVDSTVGPCRTYNIRALPEVRAGLLTVRRGNETFSIPPSTMLDRNLYTLLLPNASPPGTVFSVSVAGNDHFPPFMLEERSPIALTITNPPQRVQRPYSTETPILIEWRDDGSSDTVLVVFVGLETPNGTPIVTSCRVPISDGRFEITPEILRRYASFTGSRRIDVMRARVARGLFANAPITLTISNSSTTSWVRFND